MAAAYNRARAERQVKLGPARPLFPSRSVTMGVLLMKHILRDAAFKPKGAQMNATQLQDVSAKLAEQCNVGKWCSRHVRLTGATGRNIGAIGKPIRNLYLAITRTIKGFDYAITNIN